MGGVDGGMGPVDRQLVEVWAAQAGQLRIEVGEVPPLQQGVVAEIDARNDMRGAKRDLFRFRKEIIRIAVEHHSADRLHGDQFLRNQLGGVQHVELD